METAAVKVAKLETVHRGRYLALAWLSAVALAGSHRLELRGRLEPPPSRAVVNIEGVGTTFSATTIADSKGRFRFRKLAGGAYVVSVFVPGTGMLRRSVDVTPSLADAAGRVELTVPYSEQALSAPRSPRNRGTVSVKELEIPERARHEFDEAQKSLRKQDMDGAARHLKVSLELAPQYTMAWNALGSMQSRQGDWAAAEASFRKALTLRPGAMMTALNLGAVLLYQGRPKEAIEYNRSAVERAPASALANFQLGMAYFMLEQDENALKFLIAAKNLDPAHYSNPQLALSEIYLRHGDRDRAIGELEDFLVRHPDAPSAPRVRESLARLRP